MKKQFNIRGYVPGGIVKSARSEDLDLQSLPPVLRILMVTDGTVTKSLEAYFWEPVSVEKLTQDVVESTADQEWLDIKKSDKILEREVRLRGGDSGTVFAFARSLIKLEVLPENLRDALLNEKIGIGELVRECGLETYREVLDMGREVDEPLVDIFGGQHSDDLVYRTYRIMVDHQPAILITEYFPRHIFVD